MKASCIVSAPPEYVWDFFKKAYCKEGNNFRCKYQILSVFEGHSLTVQWKSFFTRLIFTHQVTPHPRGSEITYRVEIRGLFSLFVRYLLKSKIQKSLDSVLLQIAKKFSSC